MTTESSDGENESGSASPTSDLGTGEDKKNKRKERLEQNRISARESRKRKKTMIEELQRTVITLSRENKDLNERNETLRRNLMEIGTKYPNIVPMHAIMGGIAAPPAQQPPPQMWQNMAQGMNPMAMHPSMQQQQQQQRQQQQQAAPPMIMQPVPQHQQPADQQHQQHHHQQQQQP